MPLYTVSIEAYAEIVVAAADPRQAEAVADQMAFDVLHESQPECGKAVRLKPGDPMPDAWDEDDRPYTARGRRHKHNLGTLLAEEAGDLLKDLDGQQPLFQGGMDDVVPQRRRHAEGSRP